MDVLGDLLEPYSEQIGKIAGTITTMQFLSGVFLLNDIRRKGKSDAYPPEPFLGGLVLTVLSLKLGALMGDMPMIRVNIIGFAINVVFTLVFYWYATPAFKTKIWGKIGVAGLFTTACLVYSSFEDPEKIEFRFGMLITGILVYLIGMPMLHLGKVIEKKSTEGMPFPIILSGTMVAASWMLYGLSIRNGVVVFQNLFLCCLSSIQLSMFAIYPNTPSEKTSSDAKSNSTAKNVDKKKN